MHGRNYKHAAQQTLSKDFRIKISFADTNNPGESIVFTENQKSKINEKIVKQPKSTTRSATHKVMYKNANKSQASHAMHTRRRQSSHSQEKIEKSREKIMFDYDEVRLEWVSICRFL